MTLLSTTLAMLPAMGQANNLPDMGTTAAATLSIEMESQYGDAYMRMLRASRPIISDPVLQSYINDLGNQLVANASDVKTPFTFFLIRNSEVNAFAFFGGYVGLHTGLFLHAQDESELASVMAHEIAHVTQRHLARSMEEQAKRSPAALAAMIGSLLLAAASPEAGIAAIHATTAANMQGQINYTRSNEQEADRVGIETLYRSGFDPYGMPNFFGRLADQFRYVSKPPAMLLTHPLPESRITDSRLRAEQYPRQLDQNHLAFHLAKARVIARFSGLQAQQSRDWFIRRQAKAQGVFADSLQYGLAIVALDQHQYQQAQTLLNPLLKKSPNNRFYLDVATDIDLGLKRYDIAAKRLENALKLAPDNAVLELNLANVYLNSKQYAPAIRLLQRYTHQRPNETVGWNLLAQAYANHQQLAESYAAQGEVMALRGQWQKAINRYIEASRISELGSLNQARFDARIDQLRREQVRFNALRN
nr:M48 family metalloprotease [Vibrio stylophorae]